MRQNRAEQQRAEPTTGIVRIALWHHRAYADPMSEYLHRSLQTTKIEPVDNVEHGYDLIRRRLPLLDRKMGIQA